MIWPFWKHNFLWETYAVLTRNVRATLIFLNRLPFSLNNAGIGNKSNAPSVIMFGTL